MVAALQTEKKSRFSRKAVINSREWSQYQRDLFDFLLNGEGHCMVNAVAGSGKSSSAVGAIAHLPASAKIAVVAFNVHSVAELASKLPSSTSVSTAHKFGLSALVRYFSGTLFKPNDEKYKNLCRQGVDYLASEMIKSNFDGCDLFLYGQDSKDSKTRGEAKAMRRSAAAYMESVIHYGMASLSDWSLKSLQDLDEHFVIEKDLPNVLVEELLKFVPRVTERGHREALENHDVSLDELLYLPVVLGCTFPAYDFVFFDEGQDGSIVMQELVGLMGTHGRICFLGDSAQAIQGFSGSDAYAFDRIAERFNPTELPLSICYRCPTSHLDLARRLVPNIQDRPNAPLGNIDVVHPDRVASLAQTGDLLICRFTAPLVSCCLSLIAAGKKAMVRGRDIGAQIVTMVNSVECKFPDGFESALNAKVLPRLARLKAAEKDQELKDLEDRHAAVMTCFESFGQDCRTRQAFADRILALFCDDEASPPITLATIHRSKGDEADRVFILGSNFLPYTDKAVHEWQVKQELNLTYVALTRSKSDLFLVPLGKTDAIIDAAMAHPLGGLELPEPNAIAIAEPVEDYELIVQALPKTKEQREAIALIEQRWEAPINNQAQAVLARCSQDAPLHPVAIKEPLYTVGMLVALYHNPSNASRIIALTQDTATVKRGQQDPVTVPLSSIKPLIPQT